MIEFANNTAQISLKNPEFGDTRESETNLMVKTMMDSSLSTYVNAARRKFNLTFAELSRPKAEELRDFFELTTGERLTYIDVAGSVWSGYILNKDIGLDNTGLGRGNAAGTMRRESFTATIEFEVADAHSNL